MKSSNIIMVTITAAAIGLSGVAQARNHDGDGRGHRDGTRSEQRTERRAERRGDSARVSRGDRNRGGDTVQHRHDRRGGDSVGNRVDRRQERQRDRIRDGLRSGQLTRHEAHDLRHQQKRIRHMERRFNADGHLSHRELRRLERAQDRASRNIRWSKHNDVQRGYRDHHRDHGYLGFLWNYRDH